MALNEAAINGNMFFRTGMADELVTELYTDESPGLKVDPMVVMALSIGFIMSVVGLHGMHFTTSFWLITSYAAAFRTR
jgi:hypothetical protein